MIYAPRTLAQVIARTRQSEEIYEPLTFGIDTLLAGKLNKSTPCGNCGHSYGNHCESGMPHFEPWISCIMQHCVCGPCDCPAFVNPFNGNVTAWKPPLTPETCCGRCGHVKKHHCTKGAFSIVVDGIPRGCSHYMAHLRSDRHDLPSCDSTACAEVADATKAEFCGCPRFVSPYARRRQKPKPKPRKTMPLFEPEALIRSQENYLEKQTAREKANYRARSPEQWEARAHRDPVKARILLEVCKEFPDATATELAEASGMSASWVRRTLKRAGMRAAKPTRQRTSCQKN